MCNFDSNFGVYYDLVVKVRYLVCCDLLLYCIYQISNVVRIIIFVCCQNYVQRAIYTVVRDYHGNG